MCFHMFYKCVCVLHFFRNISHIMAQVVSFQPLTMKLQVQSQSVYVGFMVDRVTLEQVFL